MSAPRGYRAVVDEPGSPGCAECAFESLSECMNAPPCTCDSRSDNRSVHFVKVATLSTLCKDAGLKSVREFLELAHISSSTADRWVNDKPERLAVLIAGAVLKRSN